MAAKRSYRDYSENQKAATLSWLEANDGDVLKTARETGIPRTTIQAWVDQAKRADRAELRHKKEELDGDLAELFEGEARACLKEAEAKRAEASYYQLMLCAGIASDKARALREARTITPEQLGAMFAGIVEIFNASGADEAAQERFADGLRKLAALYGADPEAQASEGATFGPGDSDQR